jgi:hypothetical protein
MPASYSPPSQAQRARKAAFSSFIGAVVDWYDFLLYGIVAALVLIINFSPTSVLQLAHWLHLRLLVSVSYFVHSVESFLVILVTV